jgi:hypothetical protein
MDVITHIKVGLLKWAGQLIRMNDQQPAKRDFILKPGGSRTKGRPCSRWTVNIDMDIRTIGGHNWKAMAVNREDWRKLLREAMAYILRDVMPKVMIMHLSSLCTQFISPISYFICS